MKVLFLDFDGVLNIYPNPSKSGSFHKTAVINLEFLLSKVTDLKIVVSSSWRTYGLDAVKDILKSNGIDPRKVIDVTGHEQSTDEKDHRGYQVECWLKRHPNVKQFAIVDDNTDFVPLKHKLVKTNKYIGLTQNNVERLIEVLEDK
jgi:hypothetical protein